MTRDEKILAQRDIFTDASRAWLAADAKRTEAFEAMLTAEADLAALIRDATDDPPPPADAPGVTIGAYDGSSFPVTFTGESNFGLWIQDKIGAPDTGWVPVTVNADGTANIVTSLHDYREGFNWRAQAAVGGDHPSAFTEGEILPADFVVEQPTA